MINFGDVPAGTVLPIPFDSNAAAGESITISSFAITDIECYAGVSMTQRASDSGYTLLESDGVDLDGITGIQGFSVDLGDNADAGHFVVGTRYRIVVSAITVDGKTVNFTACIFRIVAAESVAGKPVVDVGAWLGTVPQGLSDGNYVQADVRAWLDNGVAATSPGVPNVNGVSLAVGVVTATAIATDAVTAAKLHSDVATEIAGGIITDVTKKINTATT